MSQNERRLVAELSAAPYRRLPAAGFVLTLRGAPGEVPRVEITDPLSPPGLLPDRPPELVAEWTAGDLVSDIALRKLAATARECEDWSERPLPIAGPEWGGEGAAPAVTFWLDPGWVTFHSHRGGRVRLGFTVRRPDGAYASHPYEASTGEMAAFGHALTRALDEYGPWDGGRANVSHPVVLSAPIGMIERDQLLVPGLHDAVLTGFETRPDRSLRLAFRPADPDAPPLVLAVREGEGGRVRLWSSGIALPLIVGAAFLLPEAMAIPGDEARAWLEARLDVEATERFLRAYREGGGGGRVVVLTASDGDPLVLFGPSGVSIEIEAP